MDSLSSDSGMTHQGFMKSDRTIRCVEKIRDFESLNEWGGAGPRCSPATGARGISRFGERPDISHSPEFREGRAKAGEGGAAESKDPTYMSRF